MVSTPNFQQLKDACGSNELHHCFQFLFLQEKADNEEFIRVLAEKRDDVIRRMHKRRQLLNERQGFSLFDPVAGDGFECMEEAQVMDGEILAALETVLGLGREARVDKEAHLEKMCQYD